MGKYLEPLDAKSKGMIIVLVVFFFLSVGYFMKADGETKYPTSSSYVSSTTYVGSASIVSKYPASASIANFSGSLLIE